MTTANRFLDGQEKAYLRIAMPAAMEGVFMILLSSVDLIMVGTLGTAAIAAVSIFTQPRMMILCVTRSMASAVTLLTAQLFGMGRAGETGSLLKQSLLLGAIVLGVLHGIFYWQLEAILLWMGAEPAYLGEAMVYGEIALGAVFLTSLATILQAGMMGFGRTGAVMEINVWGNVINILVNALLIFGLGPFPALGVKGAAIGTVTGALYTMMVTLRWLRREGVLCRGTYLPGRDYFRQFLPVFGGVFSEQGCERIGMVLYTRMAAELGTIPYAVHAICMNFCDFYYCFAGGMGKASMVLAGQALGRGSREEWQRHLRSGLRWSFLFSTISFALTFLLREEIFAIYSTDAEAMALGSVIMIFVAAVSFPEAHAMICAGALRGSGKTTQVAAYSFLSITILRPIVTGIFLYHFHMGLAGAWLALAIDQTIRAACSSFLLRRVWKRGAD